MYSIIYCLDTHTHPPLKTNMESRRGVIVFRFPLFHFGGVGQKLAPVGLSLIGEIAPGMSLVDF